MLKIKYWSPKFWGILKEHKVSEKAKESPSLASGFSVEFSSRILLRVSCNGLYEKERKSIMEALNFYITNNCSWALKCHAAEDGKKEFYLETSFPECDPEGLQKVMTRILKKHAPSAVFLITIDE